MSSVANFGAGILSLVGFSVGLGACSLGTLERRPCESDADCAPFDEATQCGAQGYCTVPEPGQCEQTVDCQRDIGFGSVCVEGACKDASVVERCAQRAFPEDLWTDLDAHRDRLVFGMMMDRSVAAHIQRENAAELAATQINGQRGIDGRRLGLVFCDVQSGRGGDYDDGLTRPDAAVVGAKWLVDTLQVPALIGAASSGDTTRVFTEVVLPAGGRTVEMTPSSTSPSLTDLDPADASDEAPGLLWRSAPSATRQGQVIAQHMGTRTDVQITDVAIIHEEAAFGEGVASAFADAWRSDFSGRFELFSYEAGNRAALLALIDTVGKRLDEFQALLVLAQVDEVTDFMAAATDNQAYSDDLPLYFGDTGVNREIFDEASNPRLFDNVLAAAFEAPDSFVYSNFRDAFMDRYQVDPADSSFTANSYDAVWLLALGAAWATFNGDGHEDEDGHHWVDGLNIARGLRKTVGGSAEIRFLQTEWPGGLTQLSMGRAIEVTGAAGNHDWDPDSEEAIGSTALFQWDADRTRTLIEKIE